jgi:hypothetical protein
VLPSIPKWEIVGKLVVIDVNLGNIPKESFEASKSDGCT